MGSTMNVAGFIYDSCLIQISDDKEWSQIIFTQHSFLFFFHTPSLLLCTCSRVTSSTSSSLSKRYMKICHTGAVRLHSSGSSLHQCQLNNCLPLITAQIRPRWPKHITAAWKQMCRRQRLCIQLEFTGKFVEFLKMQQKHKHTRQKKKKCWNRCQVRLKWSKKRLTLVHQRSCIDLSICSSLTNKRDGQC